MNKSVLYMENFFSVIKEKKISFAEKTGASRNYYMKLNLRSKYCIFSLTCCSQNLSEHKKFCLYMNVEAILYKEVMGHTAVGGDWKARRGEICSMHITCLCENFLCDIKASMINAHDEI